MISRLQLAARASSASGFLGMGGSGFGSIEIPSHVGKSESYPVARIGRMFAGGQIFPVLACNL
jgi:hypothetical protein